MFNQTWFGEEEFATEKAPHGFYELRIPEEGYSKNFSAQEKLAKKDESVVHPAILLYALFDHFEKTGERLLEYSYARTSGRASGGSLVCLGSFGSKGARVSSYRPGRSHGFLGVCFSRMTLGTLKDEPLNEAEASSRSVESLTKLSEKYKHVQSGIIVEIQDGKITAFNTDGAKKFTFEKVTPETLRKTGQALIDISRL